MNNYDNTWRFSSALLVCLTVMITSVSASAAQCISTQELMRTGVLIETPAGQGLGSGVLYDDSIVLTSASALAAHETVAVYLPRVDKTVAATILYRQMKPNLALLTLSEPQSYATPLRLARSLMKSEPLRLVSFPFSERHRLGVANAKMHTLARFRSSSRLEYFNASLQDWGFYGDQGGVLFNCKGDIAGVHLGPLSMQQQPDHIYAVHVRAIVDAMKRASVTVRRAY